jgi:hypothetical protein
MTPSDQKLFLNAEYLIPCRDCVYTYSRSIVATRNSGIGIQLFLRKGLLNGTNSFYLTVNMWVMVNVDSSITVDYSLMYSAFIS